MKRVFIYTTVFLLAFSFIIEIESVDKPPVEFFDSFISIEEAPQFLTEPPGISFTQPLQAPPPVEREVIVTVTATAYYGPLPGQSNYKTGSYEGDINMNGTGITKSGKKVQVGHIAADWSIFPEGTRLYIPGYGEGVVEDIGGSIIGNRIDLFMGYGERALEKALQWGVRDVEVTMLKDKKEQNGE